MERYKHRKPRSVKEKSMVRVTLYLPQREKIYTRTYVATHGSDVLNPVDLGKPQEEVRIVRDNSRIQKE